MADLAKEQERLAKRQAEERKSLAKAQSKAVELQAKAVESQVKKVESERRSLAALQQQAGPPPPKNPVVACLGKIFSVKTWSCLLLFGLQVVQLLGSGYFILHINGLHKKYAEICKLIRDDPNTDITGQDWEIIPYLRTALYVFTGLLLGGPFAASVLSFFAIILRHAKVLLYWGFLELLSMVFITVVLVAAVYYSRMFEIIFCAGGMGLMVVSFFVAHTFSKELEAARLARL